MRPLRQLQPRPQTAAEASLAARNQKAIRVSVPRSPRQRKTSSACDPCRKRKTKCDGRLPRCLMCEHKGESCAYTYSITHQVTVTEEQVASRHAPNEMIESLRTLPEEQALELLQKLRHGSGSASPAAAPSDHHHSEQQLLTTILPPSRNSLDFELAIRHPLAYPTLSPIPYTDTSLETLLGPMVMAPLPPKPEDSPGCESLAESRGHPEHEDVDMLQAKLEVGEPELPRPLFDQRLRDVDVTLWTCVGIPSRLAVQALSHYFEVDHAVLPLFSASLFIGDLVKGKRYFCSTLLVNSLLCLACLAYAPIDADAARWTDDLFDQARQDFAEQSTPSTLTTIAALQLLSICAAAFGRDELSLRLMREGTRLGRAMGLFDANNAQESAQSWLTGFEDWMRAASYTAWGVFNWTSSVLAPKLDIETPPLLPRPWELKADVAEGDSCPATGARHLALVSSAMSDMWVMVNEALGRCYGTRRDAVPQDASLEFAEDIYRRLLAWAANLPLELARAEESAHNVVMLHIYFHTAVMDLFRPLLAPPRHSLRLSLFSSPYATPEAVYAASAGQLRRLLLVYRLTFTTAACSVLWQNIVVRVAGAMKTRVEHAAHHDQPHVPITEWLLPPDP
ncbi:Nitrogen assimilation transcription factor nirA [Colletotrichum sidae]|uniref:Nitrogen assimilation transcription factor nirA n=1 Tax=Colletotrichum sidae TaxID=1347389 RepID=A0A4R8T0W3_9PEZI|nr:Nitrogen assimilation transcription factor nirA [Colletotrichum sidae]